MGNHRGLRQDEWNDPLSRTGNTLLEAVGRRPARGRGLAFAEMPRRDTAPPYVMGDVADKRDLRSPSPSAAACVGWCLREG